MSSSASTAEADHPRDGFLFTAGPALASGATQAVLFNPVDRALYVRVKYRRKRFLDWRNFERPFQGFFNAAVYRTLVGASYMFWQDSARIWVERCLPEPCQASTSPQLNSFIIGLFAGSVNGFALNTLQAVKFRMWNTDEKGVTFLRTAKLMFQEGGVPIFFRGCTTTILRDAVFGVVYETTRRSASWKDFFDRNVRRIQKCESSERRLCAHDAHDGAKEELQLHSVTPDHQPCGMCVFVSNLIAAITASMLSSPFNYVRSVVYGTPPGAIPLGYWTLLTSFYTQFFYIWRNGRSYTELYRMPKLDEVENAISRHNAATRGEAAAGRAAGYAGHSRDGANGIRQSPASTARHPPAAPPQQLSSRLRERIRSWAVVRHHHPIAACKWANSRLNIGWGSIRLGLGMAMSQSLFHFAQDFARSRNAGSGAR